MTILRVFASLRAMDNPAPLSLSDCINQTCPWSGKPVSADSLTTYRGHVVGFCNPGCRDKFQAAAWAFDQILDQE